jgi:aryl-alcohol dehydrogenase-like predicted oxidoreductase
VFDEEKRELVGEDFGPAYIRQACEASLRRLGVERIDLYQLHLSGLPTGPAESVAEVLDELRDEGKIRTFGWSTDDVERAACYAVKPGCSAIQHDLNVFTGATEMVSLCERHNLTSINRAPLAMGLLSGKFGPESRIADDDVRGKLGGEWVQFFKDGRPVQAFLDRLAAVREMLTSDGRTLVQGALAWIWARSQRTVPIPGFKSARQVEENAGAMAFGPLPRERMDEIESLLRGAVSA